MKNNLYLGLVHYPVYNKFGEAVQTSITNLDLHDIARSCLTFGIKKYYVIHPLDSMKEIVTRIMGFWESDIAKIYNKDRVEALNILEHSYSIDETIKSIVNQEQVAPIVITTTAKRFEESLAFSELSSTIPADRPILLLFGTGNGLHEGVIKASDYVLEPILGSYKYNHLSVRSAVAIILDRLNSEE
ncbi:MAG: RNA methyltransferase [Candidatus Cloacimonadales bacterium]